MLFLYADLAPSLVNMDQFNWHQNLQPLENLPYEVGGKKEHFATKALGGIQTSCGNLGFGRFAYPDCILIYIPLIYRFYLFAFTNDTNLFNAASYVKQELGSEIVDRSIGFL